jgi:hypothetical protein
MNHYNIVTEYMQMHASSMMPKLICSAFSCTSIYSFNLEIYTDIDYAPARSLSINPQVPSVMGCAHAISDTNKPMNKS